MSDFFSPLRFCTCAKSVGERTTTERGDTHDIMGRCRFNPQWLVDSRYSVWFQEAMWKRDAAYVERLTTLGHLALESHMKSEKHKAASASRPSLNSARQLLRTLTLTTSLVSSRHYRWQQQQHKGWAVVPCMLVEARHFGQRFSGSLKLSNKGISKLFKVMFSDSEIATTFTCGKNKTSYITKLGLAPYITNELIKDVNEANGGFVAMFDESLNKTAKTKQLDIHLGHWSGDHVASRSWIPIHGSC